MGGFFGAIAKRDVALDVFFGVDYHSHLGTRRGGMVIYHRDKGFQRQIHNIENTPFRTKFEKDLADFNGCSGIGCISDTDPQPLLVRSHLGLYAIATVGIINNADALVDQYFSDHGHQFMAMSSGKVNATELAAALINKKDDLVSGIRYAQEQIDGSATILILTPGGIIAARAWASSKGHASHGTETPARASASTAAATRRSVSSAMAAKPPASSRKGTSTKAP